MCANVIRVGIIGCGWVFQNNHLIGYLQTKLGYIHGFLSNTIASAEKAQKLYIQGMKGQLARAQTAEEKELCNNAIGCKIYSDFEELLQNVDAIDICTHTVQHIPYAIKAAKAGKQILCEKPFVRCYAELQDQVALLKKVPFSLFTQTPYHPAFQKVREIIESGKIGEIVKIRCRVASLDVVHILEKAPYWDPLQSGGGVLMDIGSHAFSVMHYWLGANYQIQSVQDTGIQTVNHQRTIEGKSMKIKVEDQAKLRIAWQNSANKPVEGIIEVYWLDKKQIPRDLTLAGLCYEAEGTKGTIIFPKVNLSQILGMIIGKAKIPIFYKDGKKEVITIPMPKPQVEVKILIDEFLSGTPSRSSLAFAVDLMIALNSGYLSKKRNGQIIRPADLKAYAIQMGSPEAMLKDLFNL